jgi:hypothetical protein
LMGLLDDINIRNSRKWRRRMESLKPLTSPETV